MVTKIKCGCGLEYEARPPATWVGMDEFNSVIVEFKCGAGHPAMLALDTIKDYHADRSRKYPPKRGEYFKGKEPGMAFQFCCPICKSIFGVAAHQVGKDGKVTPSIVCPNCCGFHSWVTFNDWRVDD